MWNWIKRLLGVRSSAGTVATVAVVPRAALLEIDDRVAVLEVGLSNVMLEDATP